MKKTGRVVPCSHCGCPIYRATWQLREYKHHYCSQKCHYAHRNTLSSVALICKQCGKSFSLPTGEVHKGRQFCSRECCGLAGRKRISTICPICNEVFEAPISTSRQYCSRECAYIARRKGQIVKCAECGKEIWSVPSRPCTYCSRECFRKATVDFRKTERFVLNKIDAVLGHCYTRLCEYTFDWLRNPATGHNLYIDVYYPDLSLAIEYNGIYHYKKNKDFDARYTLERRQRLDTLKATLLAEHNVELLTIRFDEPRTAHHYRKRLREVNIPV